MEVLIFYITLLFYLTFYHFSRESYFSLVALISLEMIPKIFISLRNLEAMLSYSRTNEALIFYAVCFVLFRYFDIMKPFPVSYFDKKHKNSFGVIMDDVCAGLYVVLSLICFMVLKSYIL